MEQSGEAQPPQIPNSDELLRLVVESAIDYAIFSMDPTGIITSWNIGAERLLGYTEDSILGRTADVIFTPEDQRAGAADEERAHALADGRALDERWQMRQDGSRFWASGLMMPLADPRLGFVKILRDRTEHHRAEVRLRENEGRFRLLATNIPQLVFRAKSDGSRTWDSPQWIDFTGLSLSQSIGFGWLDAIHPEDREITIAAWRTAAGARRYECEHRIRRHPDGEYRWHQTRALPIETEAGSDLDDWVGTMTDIHDLRSLQDRQRVLMAELQHRTRNLLAVVQAIAGQTLRKSATLEAFGTEFQGRLRALGRVQGLLAGTDEQAVDLGNLVAAELAAHDTGTPGEKVSVDGTQVTVQANAAQAFGLALHELATNAVKYGALAQPAGRLEISWRVDETGPSRWVTLDWRESGVVMPVTGSPPRKGYGTELIERALPYQMDAETALEFGPDGVRCRIRVMI